nr:DUF1127 domain-containing protein [Salinarimonas rosea]
MAWLRAHRDAQRLHALDDRLLADMGISRGRIDAAVRDGDLHSRKGERR